MHMEVFAALALLLPLNTACDGRAGDSKAPPPGAPTQAPAAPSSAEPGCRSDADCTRPWHPSLDECGPLDRCYEGRCLEPPAMSGLANAGTGRVVFETPSGEKSWQVEVVRTGFETQRGLMCRPSMRSDWGMLFFMESARPQTFWMKNTLIPLDMIFIAEDWTVAGVVSEAPPRTLDPRGVREPSKYVLELSSGEARRAGIAAGTRVRWFAPRGAE